MAVLGMKLRQEIGPGAAPFPGRLVRPTHRRQVFRHDLFRFQQASNPRAIILRGHADCRFHADRKISRHALSQPRSRRMVVVGPRCITSEDSSFRSGASRGPNKTRRRDFMDGSVDSGYRRAAAGLGRRPAPRPRRRRPAAPGLRHPIRHHLDLRQTRTRRPVHHRRLLRRRTRSPSPPSTPPPSTAATAPCSTPPRPTPGLRQVRRLMPTRLIYAANLQAQTPHPHEARRFPHLLHQHSRNADRSNTSPTLRSTDATMNPTTTPPPSSPAWPHRPRRHLPPLLRRPPAQALPLQRPAPRPAPQHLASDAKGCPAVKNYDRLFQRPWIDHVYSWGSRDAPAAENMPDYGRELGTDCRQRQPPPLLQLPPRRKKTPHDRLRPIRHRPLGQPPARRKRLARTGRLRRRPQMAHRLRRHPLRRQSHAAAQSRVRRRRARRLRPLLDRRQRPLHRPVPLRSPAELQRRSRSWPATKISPLPVARTQQK